MVILRVLSTKKARYNYLQLPRQVIKKWRTSRRKKREYSCIDGKNSRQKALQSLYRLPLASLRTYARKVCTTKKLYIALTRQLH